MTPKSIGLIIDRALPEETDTSSSGISSSSETGPPARRYELGLSDGSEAVKTQVPGAAHPPTTHGLGVDSMGRSLSTGARAITCLTTSQSAVE